MSRTFMLCLACCLAPLSLPAQAQEFRVSSRIETDDGEQSNVVARSLTLWHVGKVYDLIYAAGEVTILEPAHRRCWILNSQKKLITSVELDELQHLLETAEVRWAEQSGTKEFGDPLRFQLRPKFESRFDPREQRLTLSSKWLTYDVIGNTSVPRDVLDAYLNYADWACRLNFVLHPQPVFPTARLELNNELRRVGLMPHEVRLRAQLSEPLKLRATHKVSWALEGTDRSAIHQWESLLRDSKMRRVTLTEYRRELLVRSAGQFAKRDE